LVVAEPLTAKTPSRFPASRSGTRHASDVEVETDQLSAHRVDPAQATSACPRGTEVLDAVPIDDVPPIELSQIMRHRVLLSPPFCG
jgi:hypothetical protein